MTEQLYYGLAKIADRLGVSVKVARTLIKEKRVRAFKLGDNANAPWCCTESNINEDITRLGHMSIGNMIPKPF